MRKLLFIVFVFLCGMAVAQTPTFDRVQTRQYYCPGEPIQFYVSNPDPEHYTQITILGPLDSDGNEVQGTQSWNYPYIINPTDPSQYHIYSGYYRLRARYNNIVQNYDLIEIIVVNVNITVNGPFTIQEGQTVQLQATGDADFYVWNPATGLDNPNIANPMASPTETTTYTVTGYFTADNRTVNGDFEQAGSCATGYGFTSGYECRTGSGCLTSHPGSYSIYNNAHYVHSDFYNPSNHGDPGCGSGKYMIVNGNASNSPYTEVWTQTITVRPNVVYAFSANVCSFSNQSKAQLQFCINGTLIGEPFTAPDVDEGWRFFYETWQGSTNTSITVSIVNLQTGSTGNDFGIDNIHFNDLLSCTGVAQIEVDVQRAVTVVVTAPATICEGSNLVMGTPSVTVNFGSGTWTPVGWEIGPSPIGPFVPLPTQNNITIDGMPIEYNGYYIRYKVMFQGNYYWSDPVRITIMPGISVEVEVDNNPICEGEEVTLQAIADTTSLEYLAVGDILCTDGTIEKPANWPVAGKVAKGVVFYVDDSRSHGWAVSITDIAQNTVWCTGSGAGDNILVNGDGYTHWRDAIEDENGYNNTYTIRHRSGSNINTYPAAWVVDFDGGWYLPAAGQLNRLYGELVRVNASLNLIAGATTITDPANTNNATTPLTPVCYWSSTENRSNEVVVLEVFDGMITDKEKQNQHYIRAIIDF